MLELNMPDPNGFDYLYVASREGHIMRNLLVIASGFLVAFCLFLYPAKAQSDSNGQVATQNPDLAEAEALNTQIVALYKDHHYDKATSLAKRVLLLREKALGPNHFLVADALANLGELLYVRGSRTEALKAYRRYLSVYDKNRDVDTRDTRQMTISALNRYVCLLLGNVRTEYKDFEEAFDIQKKLYEVENGFELR